MNAEVPNFLPERLRPPTTRRKRKRGLALLSVVPVMLLALPRWQVGEVVVQGCPKLPESTVYSLQELVGQPAMGLDLQSVRDRIEAWPGIGKVDVELELPGTVHVRTEGATSCGSLRVGRSWHGVAADGSMAGTIAIALPPVLEGFVNDGDRSDGLEVVKRLQEATGGRVMEIRRVTPVDYRLRLQPPGDAPELVAHVQPIATDAEIAWCAAVAGGSVAQRWADLRWHDRIVVGGGS
jgi:hypothetical protein